MTAPGAPCRRALALQRQITSPPHRDGAPTGVWITDGLLASAFERYCRVSHSSWNRKASSVPGPLESQRRLGRRRLADAGTWCGPPTPPAWAFPVPLNLSQWTWKPPSLSPPDRASLEHGQSLPDDTHAHAYTNTHSLGVSAVLREWWLGRLSQAQEDVVDETPVASTAAAALPDTSASAAAAAAAAARKSASPLAAEMDDFRWAMAHADEKTFASHAKDICHKLRQLIFLGEVLPEDVLSLSVEVFQGLESKLQSSLLRHELSLYFCEAIFGGMADSKVFTPDMLNVRFWNALLHEVGRHPADDTICDLLVRVVAVIPAAQRTQVSSGVLSILGRFFSAWSCSPEAPGRENILHLLDADLLGKLGTEQERLPSLPSYMRQARKLSQVLRPFAREPDSPFLLAAHRLALATQPASSKGRRVLRYSWLYVLTQLPRVKSDFLFAAAAAFTAPSLHATSPLTDAEACSLLMAQWSSRGFRDGRRVCHVYKRHCGDPDQPALSSLFLALSECPNPASRLNLYRNAWKLLFAVKKQDAVLQSLESSAHPAPRYLQMLEDLATTSNNHRLAIRLRDLWTLRINPNRQQQQQQLRQKQQVRDWSPSVLAPYVEAIIADPDLPPNTIWRVLDIKHMEGRKPWRKTKNLSLEAKMWRHHGSFGAVRSAMAAPAAVAFAAAATEGAKLSRRSALRHVSQAYLFIRAVGESRKKRGEGEGKGEVPPEVFRAMYDLLTRDLWEGKPGVTKRLLWFLSTVERQYGVEVAWECRVALRRWRGKLRERAVGRGVAGRMGMGVEDGKEEGEVGGSVGWESEPARAAGHGGG